MDDQTRDVGSTPVLGAPVEGWMLREDVVREVFARLARGEQVNRCPWRRSRSKHFQNPQRP